MLERVCFLFLLQPPQRRYLSSFYRKFSCVNEWSWIFFGSERFLFRLRYLGIRALARVGTYELQMALWPFCSLIWIFLCFSYTMCSQLHHPTNRRISSSIIILQWRLIFLNQHFYRRCWPSLGKVVTIMLINVLSPTAWS